MVVSSFKYYFVTFQLSQSEAHVYLRLLHSPCHNDVFRGPRGPPINAMDIFSMSIIYTSLGIRPTELAEKKRMLFCVLYHPQLNEVIKINQRVCILY